MNLTDTSLTSSCEKVFQVLEAKFGEAVIKYFTTLLIASRDGLKETEIFELLNQSNLIGDSVSKVLINICWIMSRGPMLLQINRIRFMDNKLKNVACKRYSSAMDNAHKILYQFYSDQPNAFSDAKGKHQWYNTQKFNELPYQSFIIDRASFSQSIYLTDLNWIQTKLKATKCVQNILNDIYLIDAETRTNCKHLEILQRFLETYIQPINYDADQFYPLFKHFIIKLTKNDAAIESNAACKKWLTDFENIPISYLDIINPPNDEVSEDDKSDGYDLLCNLGGRGYFVASLNTKREEICVWNVPK